MKQPAGRARRTNVDAALRFAAGKLCLWSLCGNAECRRMRACGGDVRACAKRLCDWLDALEDERVAAPRFELMNAISRRSRSFAPIARGARKSRPRGEPFARSNLPDLRRKMAAARAFYDPPIVIRPGAKEHAMTCLLYTSPSPRDRS